MIVHRVSMYVHTGAYIFANRQPDNQWYNMIDAAVVYLKAQLTF